MDEYGVPLEELGVHFKPDAELPALRETLQGDAVRLQRAPGSDFEYSNTNYALFELLIEELTGRDFAEYMDDEVLDPLGMEQASFDWRQFWAERVPTGFDLDG